MKGRASHAILEKGLQVLVNLDHRGATGADATLGDGCGVLTQIPHRFFAEECAKLGFALPAPGHYAIGQFFMPRDAESRARAEAIVAEAIAEEGCDLIGWRDIPVDNSDLGERVKAVEPVQRQVFIGRRATIADEDAFERRLFILRKVISNRVYAMRRRHRRILSGVAVVPHHRLQGHGAGPATAALLQGPARPALRDGAGARPPAFRHQHLPVLAARPSLPDGRPQRRDQHPARQRQLDGGAAGERRFRIVRRRHLQAVADLLRRPVRHRLLRQRARVPGARRLLARPCDDDADPGGLGRQPADGRGAARLLRVPRRGDGAVGRPGGDGLHRRPPDRRHARPQRPEAGALFRHRRRAVRARLRNGRAADPGREDRHQVAPAAGQDAARRSGRGPHHLRRRDQEPAVARQPLPAMAGDDADRARGAQSGRAARVAHRRLAARSAAGVRLYAGGPRLPDVADGGDGSGGGRLDGRRHADLGAQRQVEAALHLFQAELRPGHQPADRPDPRRAGDEPGVVHRPAAQSVRPRRPRAPQAARSASADPHQRGSGEDPLHRPFRGFVRHQDARHHL